MSNILVKAVQDAMYVIPEEILTEVYTPRHNGYAAPSQSLSEQILALTIRPRVIPDANIAKGENMRIWLGDIKPRYIEDYRCIFEIPESKLPGKSILSVSNVSYTPMSGGIGSFGFAYGGVGPLFSQDTMTAVQQMTEASSAIPNVSTAKVELIGENVIMIEDAQRYNTAYVLNCYVTDNNYLNKIDPRTYEYFSTLCEYAIKAHVYRKLRIRLDRGRIEGGSMLGAFKEVVDEYADAETNYRTFLREKWAKVAFMDNRQNYMRWIRSQIPIGL